MGQCPAAMLLLIVSVVSLVSISEARAPAKAPRFDFVEVTGGGNYKPGTSALLKAKVTDDDHLHENDDWKFCTWTRLKDGAYCTFSYECDGPFCDLGSGDFYITTSCSERLNPELSSVEKTQISTTEFADFS